MIVQRGETALVRTDQRERAGRQANGLAARAHTCCQVFAGACSERKLVQARGAGAVEGASSATKVKTQQVA